MKIEEFKERLREAKLGKDTANVGMKVKTNSERTEQTIYMVDKCPTCKREDVMEVRVSFSKPQQLTIFQAGMLFSLYCLNKKPRDYAQYHKCIAGKEFIESIKEIR